MGRREILREERKNGGKSTTRSGFFFKRRANTVNIIGRLEINFSTNTAQVCWFN